ncbi:MAG: carboxypeptidase-like regulatory domain-containing protein [Pyrinomonadaceae bacterium]
MLKQTHASSQGSRFSTAVVSYSSSRMMLAAPVKSYAQTLYGSITGNVTDPNGAAIPGGSVMLTNTGTNQSREATTDGSGSYTFSTLEAGNYTVTITHPGFKTLNKTDVAVTINTTNRIDAALEAGQVAETVTVSSESAALLQTETAEVKNELTSKQLGESTRSPRPKLSEPVQHAPGFFGD